MACLASTFLVTSVSTGVEPVIESRLQDSVLCRRQMRGNDSRTITTRPQVLQNETVASELCARTHTARATANRAHHWTISAVFAEARAGP
jgi:hypothetical protein